VQRAAATVQRRRHYHHGDLRRALIDAALALTLKQGPGTYKLADLCRAVRVSTAAPYRHFESLDQLLAEAACEGFALLNEKIAASFRGADWQARLASCLGDYLGFIRANPAYAVMMFRTSAQTVAEPDFNPTRPLNLPAPRNATEASVYEGWRSGNAIFARYAEGLAEALVDSPLAQAVATRPRALETALALFAIMHGIAAQWLDRLLPDDWLDRGSRKAFEKIVLPWAVGVAAQLEARRTTKIRARRLPPTRASSPRPRTRPQAGLVPEKAAGAATSDVDNGLAGRDMHDGVATSRRRGVDHVP
jgi:AcrR family transcriptional regulator